MKGKILKVYRADDKINDLGLYENPLLDYDYLKPNNPTFSLNSFNNEMSIDISNKILDELGDKIEPPPIKPIPMPYTMAKINNV